MKALLAGGSFPLRIVRYALASRHLPASQEGQLFTSAVWTSPSGTKAVEPPIQDGHTAFDALLQETGTRFFQVRKRNRVVYNWRSPLETAERPCKLYSLTKSVFSLLWGAAWPSGLPGLDTTLGECLPEAALHPAVARIPLESLFRMTSGLRFHSQFTPWSEQTRTYLTPDARRTAMAVKPVKIDRPFFHYNDYATLLLGCVLEKILASRVSAGPGSPLTRFLFDRLLTPMDLPGPVLFNLDSEKSAFPKVESGLNMTVSALGELGHLILNRGKKGARELISGAWIDQSTGPEGAWVNKEDFLRYQGSRWGNWLAEGNGYYKYHWWGIQGQEAFFALGIRGQVLLISPRDDLVVVRLADRWALDGWWPQKMLDFARSLGE